MGSPPLFVDTVECVLSGQSPAATDNTAQMTTETITTALSCPIGKCKTSDLLQCSDIYFVMYAKLLKTVNSE